MKNIKYTALVLLLVFALIGGAYAAWSEELVITGSVETADFGISFNEDSIIVQERASSEDIWTKTIFANQPDQDPLEYGSTTATLAGNTYTFSLENVYPGYESLVDITIMNDSSIPVEVRVTPEFDQEIVDEFSSELSTMNDWEQDGSNTWITILPGQEEEDVYIHNKVLGEAEKGQDGVTEYEVTWNFEFRQGVGSQAFED